MRFHTYREAVAALVPVHRSMRFWLGLAKIVTSSDLTGGEIKLTRVNVLGNERDGYVHGSVSIFHYRPVLECQSVLEAERAKAEVAARENVPSYNLAIIDGGALRMSGSFIEVIELPAGLGTDLLAGL